MSIFLIGFLSRMVVALNWLWNYLTFERGTRLITWHVASKARLRVRPPECIRRERRVLVGPLARADVIGRRAHTVPPAPTRLEQFWD